MKTYYAIVNVEDRRFGTYVPAENVAAAFETATARYKTRHPRLHVETIAVQEIAEEVKKVRGHVLTSVHPLDGKSISLLEAVFVTGQ